MDSTQHRSGNTQGAGARLRHQVASLEDEKAALAERVRELEAAMAPNTPAPESAAPYIGLKALLTSHEEAQPS